MLPAFFPGSGFPLLPLHCYYYYYFYFYFFFFFGQPARRGVLEDGDAGTRQAAAACCLHG